MDDVFSLINTVLPEASDAILTRYHILQLLYGVDERIGRKHIAQRIGITERHARTIMDQMRDQGLIDVTQQGVTLTHFGHNVLTSLHRIIDESNSDRFYELEMKLRRRLGVDHCRIVAGDGDKDPHVFELLGKAVQQILMDYLPRNESVVAVTGGSTLARIGKEFTPELSKMHDITFVPTRGGFGGAFEIQSNTIGGIMAQQTNSRYVPLFVPENISKETSKILMQDPSILRAIELSKRADSLLLSVGSAEVMAERRDISENQREKIEEEAAVGEAFGVFFDKDGQQVLRYPRLGMQLEDIKDIPLLITVVAGETKAQAIEAFYKVAPKHGWLVCDESIANKIIKEQSLSYS